LVPAQPVDTWKAHGEAGLVSSGTLQALECDLEHQPLAQLVHDFTHRAETINGVAADETINLQQFFIGEAKIRFADRHKLIAVLAAGPDAERVVRIERRALAVAALRIHEHGIDDERIALPLPPQSFRPARRVKRIAPLEHDPFDRTR